MSSGLFPLPAPPPLLALLPLLSLLAGRSCDLLPPVRARDPRQPYYIEKCYKDDPKVDECLTRSMNRLAEHFRRGIPELGMDEVEPIVIDEIGIALGSGPDGYRASFVDIHAYGVSNLTVTDVRSDLDTHQFQVTMTIPKIEASARYRSSGILILIKASGAGDYWGEYEGVKAKMYFRARPAEVRGVAHLELEQMKMDFSVRDIKMGVENVHGGNSILHAAINLFINTNAQDLLREMKPDLKKKLVQIMSGFTNRLMNQIPYENWIE